MSLKDTINSKLVEVLKARTGKERILTKTRQSGDSVDMEVLEKFMPISRDFSDDFNNDFEDKDMETIKLKLMNALKGRAMKARKPMTEEEKAAMRERFVNSEFFKILKAAQEKKINKNKEE